jgi:hypothetical protein
MRLDPALTPKRSPLIEALGRHPLRVMGLAACVLLGAALGAALLPGDLSMPRRLLGGALLGALSWLIPSFGRIIGGH